MERRCKLCFKFCLLHLFSEKKETRFCKGCKEKLLANGKMCSQRAPPGLRHQGCVVHPCKRQKIRHNTTSRFSDRSVGGEQSIAQTAQSGGSSHFCVEKRQRSIHASVLCTDGTSGMVHHTTKTFTWDADSVWALQGKITELWLDHSGLHSIPEAAGSLENLNELYLSHNHLQLLPKSITMLSRLSVLNVAHNQLSQFPETVCQLDSLAVLSLSSNQISCVSENIGRLTNLIELNLRHNKIQEIPATIGNLLHLGSLSLNGNRLSRLPDSIGSLTHLEEFTLSCNQLEHIPASIGALTRLKKLYMEHNAALTFLPRSMCNLLHLRELRLQGNWALVYPPGHLVKRHFTSAASQASSVLNYLREHTAKQAVAALHRARASLVWPSLRLAIYCFSRMEHDQAEAAGNGTPQTRKKKKEKKPLSRLPVEIAYTICQMALIEPFTHHNINSILT